MVLKAILIGGLLPGFLAAVLLSALWWRSRRPESAAPGPRWAMPIATALAVIPAELLVRGQWPPLWPVAGADRIVHCAAVVLVLGVIESLLAARMWVAAAVRVLGAGAVFWIVLGVRIPTFWSPAEGAAWIAGFALLTGAVATLLDRVARAGNSPAVAASLLLSAFALSAVLLESGNAYLAQLTGGVAAALGAALAVSFFVPAFTIAGGGVSAGVTLLATLLLCGHYYAPDGIPAAQSIPVALASLAAALTLVPRLARAGRWKRCVIAAVAAVLPAALAIGLARSAAKDEADDPYSGAM